MIPTVVRKLLINSYILDRTLKKFKNFVWLHRAHSFVNFLKLISQKFVLVIYKCTCRTDSFNWMSFIYSTCTPHVEVAPDTLYKQFITFIFNKIK